MAESKRKGPPTGEAPRRNRPDHDGSHRLTFERNKKKIMASENLCGICGQPVDKKLRYPHPMSACIDHIIPIDRGGHPSDIHNLQLAHWKCNRAKSNKLIFPAARARTASEEPGMPRNQNRILPLSMDWSKYKAQGT